MIKSKTKVYVCGKLISMAKTKTENRGGNRKGAGAKKKEADKKVSVFCTVYAKQKTIDLLGHEAVKLVSKNAAQKAVDKL